MKNSTQKIVQRTHGRDTHDTTGDHIAITMGGPQLSLLDRAYTALKESVYDALLPQTRLKPYLDDISLALDAGGNFSLDFAALDAANDGMWRQQA